MCGSSRALAENEPALPASVKRLQTPGIENFYALTDRIYSGGSPDSEDAFRALAALGIKTIITVDGAKPNVELAHRYGMRYVHLPHGYDGIPTETAARLVKAVKTFDGPVFMHCHHGKHRGAAAAAVVCENLAGWSPKVAEEWLKVAGTAPDYDGLYRSVREGHPLSDEELTRVPADFPEVAEVSALVDTMVDIDQRWDRLKSLANAGGSEARHESVLLWEQIREAQRLPEAAKHGEKFMQQLDGCQEAARSLTEALKEQPNSMESVRESLAAVSQSCSSCHKEYRDPDRTRKR